MSISNNGGPLNIRTYSLTLVFGLAITALPSIPNETTLESTYSVDQATFSIFQSGSNVTISVEDSDSKATDSVAINGVKINPDQNESFSASLGSEYAADVTLSSESESTISKNPQFRHFESKTISLTNLNLPDAAVAQSMLATKTRIRYQTFIGAPIVYAPPLGCTTLTGALTTFFYGNDRSWNPDSEYFKTRFDSIISWGANPDVTDDIAVATTQRVTVPILSSDKIIYDFAIASGESMQLRKYILTSDYVTFQISQNVANPFCPAAEGIQFRFSFFVKRNGNYTMSGEFMQIPNHEVYVRDNINYNWRAIAQNPGDFFWCFLPIEAMTFVCTKHNALEQGTF